MAETEAARPDPFGDLKAAIGRLLPADTRGRRRPSPREATRVYWEIGRLLNEHISGRAEYGGRSVERLAGELGILPRTLYRARRLYQRLPSDTCHLDRLSWSHCRLLVTVPDDGELRRLMERAAEGGWSVRRLQEELRAREEGSQVAVRGRPGVYRIVDLPGRKGKLALDLGFGVRRRLDGMGKVGKRSRRLIAELAAGEVVELSRDARDRPSLRRQWGQAESRLFTYGARLLRAPAAGVVETHIDLGLGVSMVRSLSLRGPAGSLPRGELAKVLATAPARVVVKTHRGRGGDYLADVYGLGGERSTAVIAESGDYLNALWVE